MADNGSGDSPHHFLTACHSLGAKPIKTKPYTPRCTNGKVGDSSTDQLQRMGL
jgi:hypothetical protein